MPRITISYRRSDSAGITGRIFDRLAAHYGEASVFMDIDAIPLGVDFRRHIDGALKQTDVLLVILGPRWLGPREDGTNRIDDVTDPVRIEVETALRIGLNVIPVLVEGASMPAPSALPDALRDFPYLNGTDVSAGRDFSVHVGRLIHFLDTAIAGPSPTPRTLSPPKPAGSAPAGCMVAAGVILLGLWAFGFLFHIGGGIIHVVLLIALLLLVFGLVARRGARV